MPIDVRTSGRFLDWGLLIFLRRTPLHGASMVTFAYLLTFHSITLTLTINMQYDSIPACCTHYVKWSRYRTGVVQRVRRSIALLFDDCGIRRGEWSAARPGRTLPPVKTRYPLYRRLGGPQGRSVRAENLVPTGIRSRTVQPVVSRYTDWATRPTLHSLLWLKLIC